MNQIILAFKRDRGTWSAYFMLTFLTLQVSIIGPIMPFLRTEMGLSYTQGALHSSAFALGMMAAGFLCGPLERMVGRKSAMAIATLGLALGFTVIVLARSPIISIIGTGLMGLIGSMIVVFVPLVLMGIHGNQSDKAISESNLMSYFGALIAPIAVWLVAGNLGWKSVCVISWLMLAVSAFLIKDAKIPSETNTSGRTTPPLGNAYWAYWLLLSISVGIEFCFGVWGASFLEKISGFARDNAILGSTCFSIGVLSGRFLGIFVIHKIGAWRLTFTSLCIAFVGFFIFWLSWFSILTLFGLALSGAGIANLFATSLTLALSTEKENSSKAAARSSISTGLAIILTPLLLGALADSVGLFIGYGIVPVLILMGLASLWLGRRLS